MVIITSRITIFLVTASIFCALSQSKVSEGICYNKTTCEECIQTTKCAWCMDRDFIHNNRCLQPSNYSTCPVEFIFNPQNEMQITMNRVLLGDTQEFVHISPQRTKIKIRKNEKLRMQMRYCASGSSVEIKDNAIDPVNLTYFSSCSGGGAQISTNRCDNLKIGDIVNFHIVIEVTNCPKNKADMSQTLHIYPVGISESLVMDVKLLCTCPCE